MQDLKFITKNKKVYHIVNGWGVVTSGEYGTGFQVQFPNINQVQSFKSNGFDYSSVNQVVYEHEVSVAEIKLSKDGNKLYSLGATILEDGGVDFNFNGVNNSEILKVVEGLIEVVIVKELSKGNTIEVLEEFIDSFAINMKSTLMQKATKREENK